MTATNRLAPRPPRGANTEPRLTEPVSVAELAQHCSARVIQARQRRAAEEARRIRNLRYAKWVALVVGCVLLAWPVAVVLREAIR